MAFVYDGLNLNSFLELCEDCEDAQREVLKDILRRNCGCSFLKRFCGNDALSADNFLERVPLTGWKDYEEPVDAVERGAENVLFDGKPAVFIITSGTTGVSKLIPESAEGAAAKKLTGDLRLEALGRGVPGAFDGKLFPLANTGKLGVARCGIPYGTASGVTLQSASKRWLEKIAFPLGIMDVENPASMDYLRMRFGMERDVSFIIGNNAGRVAQLFKLAEERFDMILEDMARGTISLNVELKPGTRKTLLDGVAPNPVRAEELSARSKRLDSAKPAVYWPGLRTVSCWLGGSVGRYVGDLRGYLPENTVLWDCGYGASEGKFNVPLEQGKAAGPLAAHSAFFEFAIPGQYDRMYLASEIESGQSYEMFCTTYSGLYRYGIKDLVRVDGFTGTTPNIEFDSKAGDVLNVCGEKTSSAVLMAAFSAGLEKVKTEVAYWCAVPDYDGKRYLFHVEIRSQLSEDAAARLSRELADGIEGELSADPTLPYGLFRKQGLLNSAGVVLMNPGWSEAWLRKLRSTAGEQVKLPLCTEKVELKKKFAPNPR